MKETWWSLPLRLSKPLQGTAVAKDMLNSRNGVCGSKLLIPIIFVVVAPITDAFHSQPFYDVAFPACHQNFRCYKSTATKLAVTVYDEVSRLICFLGNGKKAMELCAGGIYAGDEEGRRQCQSIEAAIRSTLLHMAEWVPMQGMVGVRSTTCTDLLQCICLHVHTGMHPCTTIYDYHKGSSKLASELYENAVHLLPACRI